MGYARQVRRQKKHESGTFDLRKAEFYANSKPSPFNVRLYFANRLTGNVKKSFIGGTSLLSDRIEFAIATNPQSRLLATKRSTGKRFVKPEHPIAARRRLKQERSSRRIPVSPSDLRW